VTSAAHVDPEAVDSREVSGIISEARERREIMKNDRVQSRKLGQKEISLAVDMSLFWLRAGR
jgi:hypothetical protein